MEQLVTVYQSILSQYGNVMTCPELIEDILNILIEELKLRRITMTRGLNGALGSRSLLKFSLSIESLPLDRPIVIGFLFNTSILSLSLRLGRIMNRVDIDTMYRFLVSSIPTNLRYSRILELSGMTRTDEMIRTSVFLVSPTFSLKLNRFITYRNIGDRGPDSLSRTLAMMLQIPKGLMDDLLTRDNHVKLPLLSIQVSNGSTVLEASRRLGMMGMYEGIVETLVQLKIGELSKLFVSGLRQHERREYMVRFRKECLSIPIRNYLLSFLELKYSSYTELMNMMYLMVSEPGKRLRDLAMEVKIKSC